MIGAGVFSAFSPAAEAAGSGLLLGLALAAAVAYCNAVASAQLAAQYPTSGGTYVYGRERLGEWWGFLAGWGFVVGKTASCAAMALTFAAYAVPGSVWGGASPRRGRGGADRREPARDHAHRRGSRACSSRSLARARRRRRRRSSGAASATSSSHLGSVFATAASTACSSPPGCSSSRSPATRASRRSARRCASRADDPARDPARARRSPSSSTRPSASRARSRPARRRSRPATTPIAAAVEAVGAAWALPVVRVGAAVASLGSLLALIAGIGRTTLAMARNGDLPRRLAAVHPRFQVPHHAELAVGARSRCSCSRPTCAVRSASRRSACSLYYAVANASAFTQDRCAAALAARAERRGPRRLRRARRDAAALVGARRRRRPRGRPRRPGGGSDEGAVELERLLGDPPAGNCSTARFRPASPIRSAQLRVGDERC